MPFNLLTAQQVADQLAIPKGQVQRHKIPRIRIGEGRGQLRYRQEDIDRYVRERIEDPRAQSAAPARRRQSRSNATGYRGMLSLKEILSIQPGGQGVPSKKELRAAEEERRATRLKWLARRKEKREPSVIRREDGSIQTIIKWD